MKNNKHQRALPRRFGRRGFLRGTSLAMASLALPRTAAARSAAKSPVAGTPHTFLFVNLRGAPDGIAMLAPAQDPDYIANRMVGGTLIEANAPYNRRMAFNSRWWLPHAMDPLWPVYLQRNLAFIPAAGLLNFNKSHFVAMDRLELGIPPDAEGHTSPVDNGFVARMLENGGAQPYPPLRGWVASNLAATSFLSAPQSLAIGNVENFDFPSSASSPLDQGMSDATDDLHEATSNDVLKAASRTVFDSITYFDNVDFNTGVSGLGNNANQYPNNNFGRQFRRAAALILDGCPPEAIEIDLGGWDHHKDEGPNPNAQLTGGGTMWTLMNILARTLERFHADLSVAHPGGGDYIDRVTTICMGEFGRRVAENGDNGTDHGKGGLMLVMGGAQVNGGVYDSHWTQIGNVQNPGAGDMTDDEGDVKVAVDYRDILSEAFVKQMNVADPRSVYFSGYGYTPLGIFN